MPTIIMPTPSPKKPISGAFYGTSGYGVYQNHDVGAIPIVITPNSPLAPLNLAGVASFPPAEVVLTWEDNPNNAVPATSFNILRDGAPIASNVTGLTFTDTVGLIADTAYTYTITLATAQGASAPSAPTGVAIPNLFVAEAVTDLVVNYFDPTQGLVDWTPSVEGTFAIDHYEIRLDGVEQANGLVPPAPLTNIVENRNYVVSVVPVDTEGNLGAVATLNYTHLHTHNNLGADIVTNGNFTSDISGWNNTNNYWVWQSNGDGQAHHPIGNVNNGLVQSLPDNGILNYHLDMRIRVMEGSMAIEILFRDQTKSYQNFGVGWHNVVYDKVCNPSSINFKRGNNLLGNVEFCHIREILPDINYVVDDQGNQVTDDNGNPVIQG